MRSIRIFVAVCALAAASACGSNSSPSSPSPTTGAANTVTIVSGASTKTSTAYSPSPMTVTTGTTVTWMNGDNTTHTVTSDSSTFNGTVAPNAQYSVTFQTAGTYTYHCTIHPGMVGSIVVQ